MSSERGPTTIEVWGMIAQGIIEEPKILLKMETWNLLMALTMVTIIGWPLRVAQRRGADG